MGLIDPGSTVPQAYVIHTIQSHQTAPRTRISEWRVTLFCACFGSPQSWGIQDSVTKPGLDWAVLVNDLLGWTALVKIGKWKSYCLWPLSSPLVRANQWPVPLPTAPSFWNHHPCRCKPPWVVIDTDLTVGQVPTGSCLARQATLLWTLRPSHGWFRLDHFGPAPRPGPRMLIFAAHTPWPSQWIKLPQDPTSQTLSTLLDALNHSRLFTHRHTCVVI